MRVVHSSASKTRPVRRARPTHVESSLGRLTSALAGLFIAVACSSADDPAGDGALGNCAPNQEWCGECTNVDTNLLHCGACDNVCGAGSDCVGGACTCAAGLTNCKGTCLNLMENGASCGACGNVCGAGLVCSGGVCTTACAPGETQCGTSCANVEVSVTHCGVCDNGCEAGTACANGACQCTQGRTDCGTGCTDLLNDPLHCGGCNVPCAVGQACAGGMCQPTVGTGGGPGTGGASTGGEPATGGVSTGGGPGSGGASTGGDTGTGGSGDCNKTGFYVENGRLFDKNCSDFIMRGVNYPYTWYAQRNTSSDFQAIAATKANSVRVVLSTGDQGEGWTRTSGQNLTQIIDWAKAQKLIVIAEVHDMTGWDEKAGSANMSEVIAYWTSNDVMAALQGQEAYVIVNIANEPTGNGSTHSQWQSVHSTAITALRGAGLRHTLMVDAPNWGQDHTGSMRNGAAALFNGDPDKNVVFSVHMYDVYSTASAVSSYFTSFLATGLPLVVGEFADDHPRDNQPLNVAEDAIMQQAEERGLGYLGWSWSGNSTDLSSLDIVQNWNPSARSTWGAKLIDGDNGLVNTSEVCSVFQ